MQCVVIKRITNRGLAFLMAVIMCFSLLTFVQPHAHATDNWVKNWGVRGAAATELSDSAKNFYTGNNTYENLSLLSGGSSYDDAPSSDLYAALKTLMTEKQTVVTSYDDTKDMFQYTDCQDEGNTISSFYSGVAIGPEWDSGATWNREHIWPNSKGDASGDGENDIMMLRPTATSENSGRGNTAYGESSGYYDPNGVSNGNYDLRGDVARIVLYVYTRWGNTGSMWGEEGVIESQDILLKWMEQDPVDTWEMGRNDSVQSITGTRNVYVDYPELAFLLFGQDIPSDITTPSNGQISGEHTTCSYGNGVVTPPTCTEQGYTTYTCTYSGCGYSFKAEYTAIIPHAFVSGVCSGCGATEPAATTLVTDVADLQVGDRIVIVAKDYDYALSTTQNNNNRGVAAVTKTDNTVSFNDDTQIITLEAGKVDGTFAFYVDTGYLYAASSSKNYLRTETTLSNNSSWTIEIDSTGIATIKAQGTYTRNWMRYNSGSSLFAAYTYGQADILIYELPSCSHSWTEATCTAPEICSLCNLTRGEAAGHTIEDGVCGVCGLKLTEQVMIYYPTGNLYITSTSSDTKLVGGTEDQAAVWTKNFSVDGSYYTFELDGKYLTATAGDSGNSLSLSEELTDCGKWELEEAADGWYLHNVGANYNGNYNQYLEYYNGFTTYGFNSNNVSIYTFQLKEVDSGESGEPADCDHEWSDATCTEPKTCSKCGETDGEVSTHSFSNYEDKDGLEVAYCDYGCGAEDVRIGTPAWKLEEGKITGTEYTNGFVMFALYDESGRFIKAKFCEQGDAMSVGGETVYSYLCPDFTEDEMAQANQILVFNFTESYRPIRDVWPIQ